MTENTKVHGNTLKAADTALMKKEIIRESHAAVHEGRLSLDQARNLGRDKGPDSEAPPKLVSRISKDDNLSPCLCGCGELVPRRFKAGHDQRLVTYAKEYVRGERELTDEQREYVEESGKLDRARQQVEKDEARGQEKIAAKTARQRKKEGEEAARGRISK